MAVALATLSVQLNQVHASELTQDTLQAYATEIASQYHLNVPHFLAVIDCESRWNTHAVGDHGTSFGLVQIHLPAHPNITKAEAEDPYFAIPFMAKEWANDNAYAWSCWRNLYGH